MYRLEYKNKDFDGIFNKLISLTKHENLHKENDIKLSASTYGDDGYDISCVVDYSNIDQNYWWITKEEENPYFQIDMRSYKVKLKGYDYKAKEFNFYEKWSIKGSNDDGKTWFDLDEQTHEISSNENIITEHFQCNKNVNKAFSLDCKKIGRED